jgi:hypothetical protein
MPKSNRVNIDGDSIAGEHCFTVKGCGAHPHIDDADNTFNNRNNHKKARPPD